MKLVTSHFKWSGGGAMPSSAEYWHIGDTPMRLRSVTERTASGETNAARKASFYP